MVQETFEAMRMAPAGHSKYEAQQGTSAALRRYAIGEPGPRPPPELDPKVPGPHTFSRTQKSTPSQPLQDLEPVFICLQPLESITIWFITSAENIHQIYLILCDGAGW